MSEEDLENTWKTIEEFPNYEINKLGQVKNKKTNFILKEINIFLKEKFFLLNMIRIEMQISH